MSVSTIPVFSPACSCIPYHQAAPYRWIASVSCEDCNAMMKYCIWKVIVESVECKSNRLSSWPSFSRREKFVFESYMILIHAYSFLKSTTEGTGYQQRRIANSWVVALGLEVRAVREARHGTITIGPRAHSLLLWVWTRVSPIYTPCG